MSTTGRQDAKLISLRKVAVHHAKRERMVKAKVDIMDVQTQIETVTLCINNTSLWDSDVKTLQ